MNEEHRNYLMQHATGSGVLFNFLLGILVVIHPRSPLFWQNYHFKRSLWPRWTTWKHNPIFFSKSRLKRCKSMKELKKVVQDKGAGKVIICTLQKFRKLVVKENLLHSSRIAIIVDECHRSHGYESTKNFIVFFLEFQQANNIN